MIFPRVCFSPLKIQFFPLGRHFSPWMVIFLPKGVIFFPRFVIFLPVVVMLILLPVNQVFTVDELDAGEELDGYRENCLQRELPAKKG